MKDLYHQPLYRSRRPRRPRRDWRGWILAIAAIVLLFGALALAYDWDSALRGW